MRITTRITWDADGNVVEHDHYDYSGPLALADRAAQGEFKQAQGTAATTAGEYGQGAANTRAALTPFYKREMEAQHAFTPGQLTELQSAAAAPLAGSAATTAGQAASEAARTRNTSGFSAGLDQAARERNQALSQANLGIGAQDIMGAQEMRQQGAQGMQGLYGTDVGAQLGAMGRRNEAIQGQVEAGKSGWFQSLMQGLQAAGQLGTGYGAAKGPK